VVRATADNIFLDPGLLARAVDLALDQNLDYVSMWTAPVGTHCEVMSLPALRFIQERADAPFTTEYLTWFLVGSPNFRRAELELPPGLRRSWRLTLDTPEDLRNIRDLVALLGPRNHGYCLEDLVAAVESDPLLEARLRTPPVGVPAPPSEVRFDYLKGAR
jgi:spore coat polysaccharide biosynthesis protein SpsF (cytidylyltransferase family)